MFHNLIFTLSALINSVLLFCANIGITNNEAVKIHKHTPIKVLGIS